MGCADGIVAAITSDCSTSRGGGLEPRAWAFNRSDISITYSGTTNLITGIAKAAGITAAVGYELLGVKKMFNAQSSIVQAEDRPNKYAHVFNAQQFEVLAEDTANVDNFNDLVIVCERKGVSGEGVLIVLGAKNGLFKSADTQRENDSNGARKFELKSMAGQEEAYSQYVYWNTSLAAMKIVLASLIVVTP